MSKSIRQLRRDARALAKAVSQGDTQARQRIANHPPRSPGTALKHADYLHVIAREQGFASWPALKLAFELHGMDIAARRQRLEIALAHGQAHVIDKLLADDPALAKGDFGLALALYERADVEAALADDPDCARRPIGLSPPLVVLCQSCFFKRHPEREQDMLAIAEMLRANGADLDLGRSVAEGSDHRLSPLYFAIGHADNMRLGRWLLEHGANPNDGESLYHATELGHHDGLELLLAHGADPKGTNALLRAMDFHDVRAVTKLLAAGARADDFDGNPVGGERPWVIPALHQAARRMSPPAMIELLLAAGADPNRRFQGHTAYAFARVFGNRDLAKALAARGADTRLSPIEQSLAAAADGDNTGPIDPKALPEAFRDIIRLIQHLPDKLAHVRRLVALGVEFDRPDAEGLTPVQLAGWEGLPDMLRYFLSLGPDLDHINGYGGTLLSTIIHGSENCPQRHERDHTACLQLALEAGVALPSRAIELAGNPEVADFLADWAETYPDQVIDGGVA